jgi:hypothetical protein
MSKVENVAVVEIGGSHDECLLSQFFALKQRGCRVYFIGTEDVWLRNTSFHALVDVFYPVKLAQGALADFFTMRRLNAYFESHNIRKVILNTAQGGHVRNLCLTAKKSTEFIGIIHTLRKFNGSFTQKVISKKIKKYVVLNDFFLSQIQATADQRIISFYPLRFPSFDTSFTERKSIKQITIIGGVENRRKDLTGSIGLMKQLVDLGLHFVFLGKSDPNNEGVQQFKETLRENELLDHVTMYDHFVDEKEFDRMVKQSDFIWPLVHPETESAVEYFRNQIPGALNVALGYKIPLLVHADFVEEWMDLRHAASYRLETFRQDLEKAMEDHQKLSDLLLQVPAYNPSFQEEKYLRFIFDGDLKK